MDTYTIGFMVCGVYVEQRIYLPGYCTRGQAEDVAGAVVSSINGAEFILLRKEH